MVGVATGFGVGREIEVGRGRGVGVATSRGRGVYVGKGRSVAVGNSVGIKAARVGSAATVAGTSGCSCVKQPMVAIISNKNVRIKSVFASILLTPAPGELSRHTVL